jgi:hypothetical protein
MHPSYIGFITISNNPWRTSNCRHHGKIDGGTSSGGEILDKTHNNQSLNPNGVASTHYKGSRDVGRLLYAPLLGLDMIHGAKAKAKAKIRCRNTSTGSINSDRLRF